MWKEEDHPLRRGEDVREERADSALHQVEDGQDADEEAGQLPHPGARQAEAEGDPDEAEKPEPVRELWLPGPGKGEGDPSDAADELRPDRLGNRDAQAVLGFFNRSSIVSSSSSVIRSSSSPAVLATSPPFSGRRVS